MKKIHKQTKHNKTKENIKMPNYQLGKIYKITSSHTDLCYIGSTCEKYLSSRLGGHKKSMKCWKNGKRNYRF